MERVGAIPKRLVVLERGMQKDYFGQKRLRPADKRAVLLMLPPAGVFHIAAAIRRASALLMSDRIEFPAQMLGIFEILQHAFGNNSHAGDSSQICNEIGNGDHK